MKRSKFLRAALATVSVAAALLTSVAPAQAQSTWPSRPVRIIVPFPAGGSTDIVARQLAQHLSNAFKQQFVVENRAGAAGNIGVDAVAKAPPDGHVLGLATSGPLANNKALYKSMPFDPQKDLTPIALMGEIPLVLVSYPGARLTDLRSLVQQAKAEPSRFSVGHPGNGTIGHLALEQLKAASGVALQSVAYKGDTPAMNDLLGGQIQVVSAPVSTFIPNIQAGKLQALAVTSAKRFPGLPQVPTAREQGLDLEATVWFAMVGPAGLPAAVVSRLNQEINAFTSSADGRARLSQFGMVEVNGPPELLGRLIDEESARWKKVVEAARITLE